MTSRKSYMTAAGTFAIALGVGFLMQSTDTAEKIYGGPETAPGTESSQTSPLNAQDGKAQGDTGLAMDNVVALSATPEVLRPRMRPAGFQACTITALATPLGGAMVQLDVEAPCLSGERVQVAHADMSFSVQMPDDGRLTQVMPALHEQAVFLVSFGIKERAIAFTEIPELDGYARTVLQWRGDAGWALKAREFSEAAIDWSSEDRPSGDMSGHVVRLGDPSVGNPHVADVYTFPLGTSVRKGTIDLSIEAQVTAKNCGTQITGQTMELLPGSGIIRRDVALTMPDCAQVGEILVLNNVISDVKVAENQ